MFLFIFSELIKWNVYSRDRFRVNDPHIMDYIDSQFQCRVNDLMNILRI